MNKNDEIESFNEVKHIITLMSRRPEMYAPTKMAYVYYVHGILTGLFGLSIPGYNFYQFLGENGCESNDSPNREWAKKVTEYALADRVFIQGGGAVASGPGGSIIIDV